MPSNRIIRGCISGLHAKAPLPAASRRMIASPARGISALLSSPSRQPAVGAAEPLLAARARNSRVIPSAESAADACVRDLDFGKRRTSVRAESASLASTLTRCARDLKGEKAYGSIWNIVIYSRNGKR